MTRFEPSLHSSGRMGIRLAVVPPDDQTTDHGCNRGQHKDTDLYRISHTTSVPSPATPWEERRSLNGMIERRPSLSCSASSVMSMCGGSLRGKRRAEHRGGSGQRPAKHALPARLSVVQLGEAV